MPDTFTEPDYGTYLLAIADCDEHANGIYWNADEIAMVFSKKRKNQPGDIKKQIFDLMFENGRTIFGVPGEQVISCFKVVYQDPDTIIDGCSTNFGWQEARKRITSTAID